ncbi:MAG: nucleotidyltransferase domain-containing protein [Chitinivibrionales bacterium]|nr:nucleotidyltransferase domain-containing protein [Chitinivibrionales bacterium]
MKIDQKDKDALLRIIRQFFPDAEIWAFGSRVSGKGLKPFSDIDLVVKTSDPIDVTTMVEVENAFNESDIALKVDIVQWKDLSERFRKQILVCHEVFYKP